MRDSTDLVMDTEKMELLRKDVCVCACQRIHDAAWRALGFAAATAGLLHEARRIERLLHTN